MYLIVLLLLVILILLYFALDNIGFILNLLAIDLRQQNQPKAKKSNKNVKKLDTTPAPVVKKSETIQRYTKISAGLRSVEHFVILLRARFSNLKEQVDYSLQDVSYVLKNVREFWRNLINKEGEEIIDTNSAQIRKQEKNKSAETQKLEKKKSKKNETKLHGEKTTETAKRIQAEENKKEKSEKIKNTDTSVERQSMTQKSKSTASTAPSKSKKVSKNVLPTSAPTNEKKTKKNVVNMPVHPTASTNEIEKKKIFHDDNKMGEGSKSSMAISNVTHKTDNNKQSNQKALSNQKIDTSDGNEWTNVDLKSGKVGAEKVTSKEKKTEPKISGKQNVITLEKNSKGKEQITVERNEQSEIKTVLVKKTKQTVYKQTENIPENKTIRETTDIDKSIGKISSIEELELIVKSFMAKDQEKAQNLMDIIQQVQNVKQHVQMNVISDKVPVEGNSGGKQKENFERTKEKTVSEINQRTVDSDLSKEVINEAKYIEDGSTKKAQDNCESLDTVEQKLEKIKNQEFEKVVGTISFEELGKIVNALVSEKLVHVPKFTESPLRRTTKKKENNGNERKTVKSNQESTKNPKISNASGLLTTKQKKKIRDNVSLYPKQQPKKETGVYAEIPGVELKPAEQTQMADQSNNAHVIANDYAVPVITNKDTTLPHLNENHFRITQNELILNQPLDQFISLIQLDSSELSEEMILRENAVKNISSLLEDESEVQDGSEIVEQRLTNNNIWSTTPNREHFGIDESDYLAPNSLIRDTQEITKVHDTNMYGTQAFQDETENELNIEQQRKAVVQELKDNFKTLLEKKQTKEVEFDVPPVDTNCALDHPRESEKTNIMLEETTSNFDVSISDNIELPNVPFDEANDISTSCVENSKPAKEVILFEHTETVVQGILNEVNTVSTDVVNLETIPSVRSDEDDIKDGMETIQNCGTTSDNLIEYSIPEDVDVSIDLQQPWTETAEACSISHETFNTLAERTNGLTSAVTDEGKAAADCNNQTLNRTEITEESVSEINEALETKEKTFVTIEFPDASNKTFHDRPDETANEIDAVNNIEDSTIEIPNETHSKGGYEEIATELSLDEDTISNETISGEVSEEKRTEFTETLQTDLIDPNETVKAIPDQTAQIAGGPEEKPSSETVQQNTSNPSVVRTFVRPLIKIDRCGDINIEGDKDTQPTRVYEPR